MFSILSDRYLRVKSLGLMATLLFTSGETACLFSKATVPCYIPTSLEGKFQLFSSFFANICFLSAFLIKAILAGMKWYLAHHSHLHFPMINNIEHFFTCLLALWISCLEGKPIQILCPSKKNLTIFLFIVEL